MKNITLIGPFVVAGRVRHPFECPLLVSDREAARVKAAGVLVGEPTDAGTDDETVEPLPPIEAPTDVEQGAETTAA